MIDLYTWPTPNGRKIHIMLEEVGLEYSTHPIDIRKGDQFEPEFLKISPNNRIPAIVDQDGPDGASYSLFESGAILMYLAEKTGKLMPEATAKRYRVIEWLMFQMGNVGPMLGQAHHFRAYAPDPIDYAIARYTNEAGRLYHVLDKRLGENEYLAGEYSIADIATYPWLQSYERQGQDINEFADLKRWFDTIEARPAVRRGNKVKADNDQSPMEETATGSWVGGQQCRRA